MNKRRIRSMELNEVAKDIAAHMVEIARSSETLFATCLTCCHFNEQYAWCVRHNGNPPPRTIVNACDDYADVNQAPLP